MTLDDKEEMLAELIDQYGTLGDIMWTTNDNREMALKDMTDRHLRSAKPFSCTPAKCHNRQTDIDSFRDAVRYDETVKDRYEFIVFLFGREIQRRETTLGLTVHPKLAKMRARLLKRDIDHVRHAQH